MHSVADPLDGKELMTMSQLLLRSVSVAALAAAFACFACGSDQKQPNTPADAPAPGEPTSSGTVPTPDDMTQAPTGEPTTIPPVSAPPQGLNEPARGNQVAMPSATTPSASPLSEGQIAKITDLANSSEIEAARFAQTKAKSPSVKKFAAMMIKHHSDARAEQTKLYQKLDLTPTASETAVTLQADSDKSLKALRGADGAAFDTAYMQAQVDAHQKVLDTIDRQLLPAATDQALVADLKKMRATVESHLTEAKRIVGELDKH